MVRTTDIPAQRRKPKRTAAPKAKHKRKTNKATKPTGRPRKDGTAEIVALEQRRLEALEFCKAGHTFLKIGKWLDPPCGPTAAQRLVMDALAEIRAETAGLVEHIRTIELARLDDMMVKPFEAAKQGDTRSIAAVLSIMERRAQIMGTDAPSRQEHSGPNGGPIPYTEIRRTVIRPEHSDPGVGAAVPGAGPV